MVKAYAGSSVTIYAFILEDLTVYELSDNATLFLEKLEEGRFTAYFLAGGVLEDVVELEGKPDEVLLRAEDRYGSGGEEKGEGAREAAAARGLSSFSSDIFKGERVDEGR